MVRAVIPAWLLRPGLAPRFRPPWWWRRALPWGSLLSGLAGALLMERAPSQALPVLVAELGALVALGLFLELSRAPLVELGMGSSPLRGRALHLTTLFGSQSLLQLGLFFVLPWYVAASAPTPAQVGFLSLVFVVVCISLWDPWYEHIARMPVPGLSLHSVALFATYNALLPVVGFAQGTSMMLAAAVAAGGTGLAAMVRTRHDAAPHRTFRAAAIPVLLPLTLALGIPQAIPPAPLRLVEGGVGAALHERVLTRPLTVAGGVPERLLCWTSIAAPRGLRDRLFHVWRHEGVVTDRIELALSGGRDEGFRTWSAKRHFGPSPAGAWSCTVETGRGQVLGVRAVIIQTATDAATPQRPDR